MDDASPSATPMPGQPLATATNPAAPFPPADSQPVFVPPSITDPVSSLDFLPVDDAFALEFRSETIEQLVRGDALRRGESERIEAGRSGANADRVAGRDRVRVHGTLHEHTGHTLAEQAAHLHTTVDGTLDVHAGSEDTVLLAGHMRDLWDGGAAIVAAMTDDTAAGGGIRVTTPLDLWLHGLMGVEERIGTCTADAVLMESSATHYEREYGPGAHAAGLAVYSGSLYQSNRSTFRPLMRVSSGVRNLIAGGGDGGGGCDAGAGDAPGASPPPAPAAGGAGTRGASETLCAATVAGGTVQAGVMAGVRSEDLTGIHLGDEVAALALGGANVPGTSGDLTELGRSTDTAGQLAALRDAMRGDEVGTQSEVTSVFRAPPLDDTASVHEASALDIEAVVLPAATVPDLDAPVLHSTVSPPQPPPGVKLGLLGGADRPPEPAALKYNFLTVYRRLRQLCGRYSRLRSTARVTDFERALDHISNELLYQFNRFGGSPEMLARRHGAFTPDAEKAFHALSNFERAVKRDIGIEQAADIHEALDEIRRYANGELEWLSAKYDLAEPPSSQAMQRPPATIGPTATVAASPLPAHTPIEPDWIFSYQQLRGLAHRSSNSGPGAASEEFRATAVHVSRTVMHRFTQFGGSSDDLRRVLDQGARWELGYRNLEDMLRRAEESRDHSEASVLRRSMNVLNGMASTALDELTARYSALDALPPQTADGARPTQTTEAMQLPPMQLPPVTGGSPVTVASTTVALAGRLEFPGPAHHIAPEATLAFPQPAGGLVHATDVPGPSAASSLPGPSLSEAADALASDHGRVRLDQTATTAGQPTTTEAIITPAPADPFSFWLQPIDPLPVPGSVPVDSGLHHASETAQPGDLGRARLDPPATATTAAQPVATEANVTPSLSGTTSFWLQPANPLPGGAVPFDTGLHHAGETVIPPPVTATASSAAPARVPALPTAAGHTGAGNVASPPAADPWRIRPLAMGGGPRPVAFDPWSAPTGPRNQVVSPATRRRPVMSIGPPPGWRRAETPGFGRGASGAVELPFSRRMAIAEWFSSEHELRRAEFLLENDADDELGWSGAQVRAVLADLYRLNAFDYWYSVGDAAMIDVDWSAIEALIDVLDAPPPSP